MEMADVDGAAEDAPAPTVDATVEMTLREDEEKAVADAVSAVSSGWSRQWDDAAARFFYTHAATGEATWDEPEGFAPADEGRDPATEGAEGAAEEGVWIAQYDPTAARVYYYHTASGAAQWDPPDGFVDAAHRDDKMDGAVKIQSVFRSKKARDRVRQLTDADRSTSSSAASEKRPARLWRQHFDPRSQQYYYHNIATGESTWEKPVGEDDAMSETDSQGDSATKIQCVFRKRAASKSVEGKRQLVRDFTSDATINQKLQDIKRAVDEIDRELDARRSTLDASMKWSQLQDALQGWSASASRIRDRVLDHHHHALLVQQLDATAAERLATAQQFHDAMAATRSECLALLKSVLLSDTPFLEVEILRVNEFFDRFTRHKGNSIFTITESKVRAVIRVDELEHALRHAEMSLRKAMGLTDFTAGAATYRMKDYSEWRDSAQAAIESVRQLERMMQHKRSLLELYEQSLIERRETETMTLEDQLSLAFELGLRNAEQERLAHARFLETCRQRWQRGLLKRKEDEIALQESTDAQQAKELEEQQRITDMKREYDQARTRVKLSIWEAVREGFPVDSIRGMIFAEMQKARQNGFDFDVRTARSSRGETLVQIACWAGHTDLTSFLLDEGADLHAADCITNGFTLLHDSARRGDSLTTRLLVDRGLAQDTADRSGDTPLHWAVRNNHYDTVHTLLGAYMHRHDPDHNACALRAARTKNNRGRKPIDLAKSECIRRLLQAFDEGRICIPQPRDRSNSNAHLSLPHGRRMTETNPSQAVQRPSTGSSDYKGNTWLTKASTTPSLSIPKSSTRHEEDEFGIINVVTSL